jgi:DNA invertase Pin-like site-specific DNA recombinase
MRKIGYARVSSTHQNLERQLGALVAEGCARIFKEKTSGKSAKNRPELERAISGLGTSDVLVLAEWDRCTRSMIDGIDIIERLHQRGAPIKVLDKPHLDLTSTIGKGFLAFLSALAQDERGRIVKRANAGREAAKAMSWPAWNMSVAPRSTHTLRMPRKSVQADLQTPSMRKGSPLALYWRTMATKSGT